VFESSNEAILITNADNRILAVNQAFTQITGYTEQDVLGSRPQCWHPASTMPISTGACG
jgi:PAS domain S-box-containing protein